jgi:hypothetical protein
LDYLFRFPVTGVCHFHGDNDYFAPLHYRRAQNPL